MARRPGSSALLGSLGPWAGGYAAMVAVLTVGVTTGSIRMARRLAKRAA